MLILCINLTVFLPSNPLLIHCLLFVYKFILLFYYSRRRLIDRASKSRARTGRGRRGRRVGVDPGTVRGTSRPLHLTGLAQQCDRSPRTDNGTSAGKFGCRLLISLYTDCVVY